MYPNILVCKGCALPYKVPGGYFGDMCHYNGMCYVNVGAKISIQQYEALKDFVHAEIRQAKIEELTALHRTNGKGLPKRDYDNVTDEAICERIEELEK